MVAPISSLISVSRSVIAVPPAFTRERRLATLSALVCSVIQPLHDGLALHAMMGLLAELRFVTGRQFRVRRIHHADKLRVSTSARLELGGAAHLGVCDKTLPRRLFRPGLHLVELLGVLRKGLSAAH